MKKSENSWLSACARFWEGAPLLFYGLHLAIGAGLALGAFFLLLILPPLWVPFRRKALLGALLLLLMALVVSCRYRFPPAEGSSGLATLSVERVAKKRSLFGECYAVRGRLLRFTEQGKLIAANIPVTLHLSLRFCPSCDQTYKLPARLEKGRGYYYLKVSRRTQWEPLYRTLGLGRLRSRLKKKVEALISRNISDAAVASLLTGLVTGDTYDQAATLELGRFGLAHLLAVSGLHFSLVLLVLRAFLRPFLPKRLAQLLLGAWITGYFLFIDAGPSALRAWTQGVIFLGSEVLERRSRGLNSLGAALIVCLAKDPLSMTSLGFVFSFVCTGAILLFYPPIEAIMRRSIAAYPLQLVTEMSFLDQHLYIIGTLFRRFLSLSLAVNAAALPLSLLYFHRFPLLGLVYNLFCPFLIGVSLILALMACLFYPLAAFLLKGAYILLKILLITVHEMPATLEFTLRVPHLDPFMTTLFLVALFALGIHCFTFRWNEKSYLPIA